MKKYLYLLAGLAAGFVLVFMGTAICQYLHMTQSGYVRYDDSVEVVYQQVAEYAGVDPATLSIHAKRQVGDDIFVLWKTPDRTEVSMTQLRQASFGGHTYLCPEAGLLARTDDDPARRYGRSPAIDKMLTTTGDPARTLLVLSGDVSDLQGGRLTLDYRLSSAISQTSGIPEQDHCPESFSVELSGPYVLIPLWLSGVPEGLYGTLYDADGQVVDTF